MKTLDEILEYLFFEGRGAEQLLKVKPYSDYEKLQKNAYRIAKQEIIDWHKEELEDFVKRVEPLLNTVTSQETLVTMLKEKLKELI